MAMMDGYQHAFQGEALSPRCWAPSRHCSAATTETLECGERCLVAFDSGTMFKKKSAKERKARAKPPSNQLPHMGSLQNGMQQERRSGKLLP